MTDHKRLTLGFRSRCLAAAITAAAVSSSVDARQTSCEASLQRSDQLVRFIYDPFEPDLSSQIIELSIRNTGARPCDLALAIAGDGGPNRRTLGRGTERLEYEILQNGVVLRNEKTRPRYAPSFVVGPGEQVDVRLQFRIRSGAMLRAGDYSDEVTLRLFEAGASTGQLVAPETPLIVSAVVPARAQLNVAGSQTSNFGANPAGSIDFGDLVSGKQRTVFVQVRSTSDILLRISSAQNGVMTHAVFDDAVQGIPYTVQFAGQDRPVSRRPLEIVSPSARRQPGKVATYPLTFRVLDASRRVAGTYQDVVTITVEPR